MPTEDISRKGPLASEFLSTLRKEWFNSHEFSIGTLISDQRYNHLESKPKNTFHPFNNQLDYILAHYFAKLETTKSNINKFLTDPLIVSLTKKLSYKNADK